MTLAAGDLTTPGRVSVWLPNLTAASNTTISLLISAQTALIYNKLSRARLFSQTFTRTLDGVGGYQILLPDWPVTSITSLQLESQLLQLYPLPNPTTGVQPGLNTFGYGYRFVPWAGNLPGDPTVVELVNGIFWPGAQNIKVVYTAGYIEQNEAQTIPAATPFTVTVSQPQGIWCRDNGITFAATGVSLTSVSGAPSTGQYNAPPDTSPGLYTFAAADAGKGVLISYSFIPSDLELACIQMVAESYSYRGRIGEIEKSLGGQETVRFMRGGLARSMFPDIPPEVESLIWPYVNVTPPAIGAPV